MSGQEHKENEEGFLSLQTLIAIIILLIYTIAAPLFEKYHFHYMHESGVCMIIGVVVTLIAMVVNPHSNMANTLEFSDEMFFTFILPPIIFAAGYNIRRKAFFKYFLYIILFGVMGTVITFLVVTPLTYFANSYNLFHFTFYHPDETPHSKITQNETAVEIVSQTLRILSQSLVSNSTSLVSNSTDYGNSKNVGIMSNEDLSGSQLKFSIKEILLFASVISATDTVAALTFVKEEADPKLFSILFGEGVLNDAVCIVLYRILLDFTNSNEEFSSKTPIKMLGSFMNLFFYSFIVGAVVGALSALFLKKLKFIKLNRVQETSVVIFFAFISYTLSEELGLSPIISLLFSGIIMSHYTFYNLSFQAREESSVVSRMMANIAEAFVFTYLGLTMIKSMTSVLSISFLLWALLFVCTGRVIAIFGLAWMMKIFKMRNFKLKFSEKGIMSCAGSIRGAIAFGLAISIDTPNVKNKQVLVNTTLILVFFTTIVFGAMMPFLIKLFKSFDDDNIPHTHVALPEEQDEQPELFTYMHPNFMEDNIGGVKEKDVNVLKNRLSYWLGTYWVDFDYVYMKPRLVHNWPQVKDDNDLIAQKIKEAIDDFNKKKNKGNLDGAFTKLRTQNDDGLISNQENDHEGHYHQEMKTLESANKSPEKNFNMFKDMTIKK